MVGYCGRTTKGVANDCTAGSKGMWALPASKLTSWAVADQHCSLTCAHCSRCEYYSVSLRYRECSWFHECDLQNLQKDISGFRSAMLPPSLRRMLLHQNNGQLQLRPSLERSHTCEKYYRFRAGQRWMHQKRLAVEYPRSEPHVEELTREGSSATTTSLALIISGQAYRGHAREVPTTHWAVQRDPLPQRRHAQVRSANSLVERIIIPYERNGQRVDVFMTVYDTLAPDLKDEV
jgi:hypothetical protein